MSAESITLAEVLLGFGGKTLYTLGTSFTCLGTIYGINKITKLGIDIFSNLHSWLGPLGPKEKLIEGNNKTILTKEDVFNGFTSFSKILLFIVIGVVIKMIGNWMGLDSTIDKFNKILYNNVGPKFLK